jgi:hypothetical protein
MTDKCRLPASFYYLLVFLFLFMPYIQAFGYVLHLPYFYRFLFVVLFFAVFANRGVAKKYLYIFTLFAISYLWVLGVSVWNGVLDINMQINYLNAFLVIFGAFGLSLFVVKRFGAESGIFLVKALYFSGVAHAVIMIAAFFVAPIRETLYSFVVLGTRGQEFIELLYRSPGLTSGGGDGLSVMQATALVLGFYYFISIKKRVLLPSVLLHLTFFILLFVSILLSARTGLVVLSLGLFLLATRHLVLMFYNRKVSRHTTIKFSALLVTFSVSIPALYLGFMDSDYIRFANRAFELYINLSEHGQVGTSSTDNFFKTMFFLPTSEMQLFFGDGNFGRDKELGFIPSDIGYVRVWFGGGLLGVILFYIPFVLIAGYFAKRAILTSLFFPLVFISSALLLVNVKVYHLYGTSMGFNLFLLVVATMSSKGSIGRTKSLTANKFLVPYKFNLV